MILIFLAMVIAAVSGFIVIVGFAACAESIVRLPRRKDTKTKEIVK